jgi:hypothetical protein
MVDSTMGVDLCLGWERRRADAIHHSVTFVMLPVEQVVPREIPVIEKIIQDETWLEGERRGCPVAASDGVVRENVCRVVLEIGQQLRDSITGANAPDSPPPDSTTRG